MLMGLKAYWRFIIEKVYQFQNESPANKTTKKL